MWRASAAALASARRWRHKLPDLVMVAGDRVERRERGTGEKARFFRVFGTLRTRAQPGNGGKVGRTSGDSRARMDESRRTPKRRGCRRIRTSDKDTERPEDLGLSVAEGAAVLRQIQPAAENPRCWRVCAAIGGRLGDRLFAG